MPKVSLSERGGAKRRRESAPSVTFGDSSLSEGAFWEAPPPGTDDLADEGGRVCGLPQSHVMSGTVEHGKELGRKLGFPTANIHPDAEVPCPNGVYAAAIWLSGEPDPRPCMINQGAHPTAPGGKPTIEAHLLNYNGDLYGQKIKFQYLRFLRPEQRFDSLEALTAQLRRDRETTRATLAEIGMKWMKP